jgi:hypothetical protein
MPVANNPWQEAAKKRRVSIKIDIFLLYYIPLIPPPV